MDNLTIPNWSLIIMMIILIIGIPVSTYYANNDEELNSFVVIFGTVFLLVLTVIVGLN